MGQGIFFGPTTGRDMFESRWDTKGAPETRFLLEAMCREGGMPFHFVAGRTLQESLEAKRKSAIVVDDLVTGSYHLTALEGLSAGKAVVCWLDERTQRVLAEAAGTNEIPFINVHLSGAAPVLRRLLAQGGEAHAVGAEARRWFESNWSEACIAAHYDRMYHELMESPSNIGRQPALRLDTDAARYFAVTLPDAKHAWARRQWWRTAPVSVRLLIARRAAVRRLSRWSKRWPVLRSVLSLVRRMLKAA